MGEALTIGVRREHGYAIVTVAGEIDIATVSRLRERLLELAADGGSLVADLDRVGFIDSAGLGALVGVAKRAAAGGGSLQVVCAQPKTRQLFRLAGRGPLRFRPVSKSRNWRLMPGQTASVRPSGEKARE